MVETSHVDAYDIQIINILEEAFSSRPDDHKVGLKALIPNSAAGWSAALTLLSAAMLAMSLFIGDRDITTVLLLILMSSFLVYELAILFELVWKGFKDRKKNSGFGTAKQEYGEHSQTFFALSGFTISSLKRVMNYLNNKSTSTNDKLSSLVGSIRRLGFLPAVVALYVAYTKIAQEELPYNVDIALTSMVVAVYVGSVFVLSDLIKMDSAVRLLETVIQRLESDVEKVNKKI